MAWNPWSQSIDAAIISGKVTPGILRLRNANSPREWDERKGYGWSGSFPIFLGIRLSRFDMGFEMYTDADWALWENMRPMLAKPPAGKRPTALDIVHPVLQQLDIKSIVVTDVKQLEIDENTGVVTQPIEVLTFRRPKIALSKPEGSADKPPTDFWDQVIEKISSENQAERAAQDRLTP